MKNLIFIFTILNLIFSIDVYPQVHQDWVRTYSSNLQYGYSYANAMTVDGTGNIYVTGEVADSISGSDIVTIKYNSSGITIWTARFNSIYNESDRPRAIVIDYLGNIYVTGTSLGDGTFSKYVTIKYNNSGIFQWARYYGGTETGMNDACGIVADGSGNVCVTGIIFENHINYQDIATIKYNSDGVLLWASKYNGSDNNFDQGNAIKADASGNIYVTGSTNSSGSNSDFITIKYDFGGAQKWAQKYDGPASGYDYASSIDTDPTGNVYVAGYSLGNGTGSDFATVKYNSGGVQQWAARYNGTANTDEFASSLKVGADGNVFVTGTITYSLSSGICTIKYNSSGIQQWLQIYKRTANSWNNGWYICLDNSDNVYVSGLSSLYENNYDYTTLKYSSSGIQQWVQFYNGPADSTDQPAAIAIDGSNNVYITGSSYIDNFRRSYTTIKYSQPIGIKQISSEVPSSFVLMQNYPNPFNPSTKISYGLPINGFVSLIIYDILGRKIETLVNENQPAGTYEINWDAANNTSGIYFYKLTTGDFTETRKMMLVK